MRYGTFNLIRTEFDGKAYMPLLIGVIYEEDTAISIAHMLNQQAIDTGKSASYRINEVKDVKTGIDQKHSEDDSLPVQAR